MKNYIVGKDKEGNTVIYFQDKKLKSVIASIPTWWSNKNAIAIYIADSMNSNSRLILEPKI